MLEKARETFAELLKKTVPKPQLDKTEIIIKNVIYGVETNEILNIGNVGESFMEYRIYKKKEINCLNIRPAFGVLMPGQNIQVNFSLLVTYEEAQKLHENPDFLKTEVEVKTSDGQVFNIKIIPIFTKTCFGASLDLLNSVYKGFAELDPKLTSTELISLCPEKLLIPKEIYLLTQWIAKYAIKTEKLFILAGKDEDKIKVREFLANYQEIAPNVDPYSVADTLVELLESMQSIIPTEMLTDSVKDYEEVGDKNNKLCELFLMKLPNDVSTLVMYLLSFCKQLLEYADYNNLSIETLVKVLANCLIKLDTREWDQAYVLEEDNEKKVKIAQIAVKRKLRFQGMFALLLKS